MADCMSTKFPRIFDGAGLGGGESRLSEELPGSVLKDAFLVQALSHEARWRSWCKDLDTYGPLGFRLTWTSSAVILTTVVAVCIARHPLA